MDISGTTYFLPSPYIANTSNNLNPNSSYRMNNIKIEIDKSTFKGINNAVCNDGLFDAQVGSVYYNINYKFILFIKVLTLTYQINSKTCL